MKYKYLTLPLIVVLAYASCMNAQQLQAPPRLVVNITIDQLRQDYLEAFAPLYSNEGFKKLLQQGKIYTNVSYPFTPVDRASAIAAIATGTTPYYNGIVGEKWLDRETLRPIYCTDDRKYKGIATTDYSSANQLTTSTLSDELKVQTNGKAIVYAIAPFKDAAVFSAGHAADGAIWIDDATGNWCSSDYYFKQMPQWLLSYNTLHSPYSSLKNTTWQPYNQLVGNFSYFISGGIKEPFKHKFSGSRMYREYKTSGLVNESITHIAQQCILSNSMGTDDITDMISLTYYAGNFDHKPLTDCQMELQDTYVRLDREISKLIKDIEKRLGANNVLFVITSTGYTDEENSDYQKFRIPSGVFYINRTANLLNIYFSALWGQGKYVETCFGRQMYLNHKLFESKQVSFTDASQRAQEFLSQIAGVRNVYTSQQLLTDNNQHIQNVREGFNPEHSGDILIDIAPGWQLQNEEYMQTQVSRASFVSFPIIIYGAGTTAQRITTAVSITRIAPAIARAIRIRAPNACSSEPLF